MIAREWKARCPVHHKEGFVNYLHQTGMRESLAISGCVGAQIFCRSAGEGKVEITLITYWDTLDSIRVFAGEDIEQAKLYPEDAEYELEPDMVVVHYEIVDQQWLS